MAPRVFKCLQTNHCPPELDPCKQLYTPRTRRLQVASQLRTNPDPTAAGGSGVPELCWKVVGKHFAPFRVPSLSARLRETGPQNPQRLLHLTQTQTHPKTRIPDQEF
jgi:hypothetical protein